MGNTKLSMANDHSLSFFGKRIFYSDFAFENVQNEEATVVSFAVVKELPAVKGELRPSIPAVST